MPEIAGDHIGYRISVDGLSQLDGLRNVIKDIKKRMPEMSKSIKAAQASVKGLNSEIARGSGSRLTQEQHGFDGVTRSVNGTGSAVKRATRQTDGLKQSMTRATRAGNFNGQVSGMQRVAQSAKRASDQYKKFSSVGDKFVNVGRNMAITSTVIGAAMLKGATDAVKLQNQYRVINNLAVYGGEKQAEVQRNVNKMQQQGSKYSVQYGVAQTKLSAGYEELIRRGYSTNQALATQKTFLQGALASGDDYTDVVHNATAAIEGFGLKSANSTKMAQNTTMAVNQMAYAADLTATDFQGMGDALRYVAATGRSANQSLSMTTSAIGILSNNGLEDTVAGTGLRKVLNSFGSPNFGKMSQQAPVMEQFGWTKKSFEDSKGNLKSLADLMDMINKKTAKMSDSQRMDIFHKFFGTTGQESALILSKNVKQLRDLNNQVKGSQNMKGGGYISQLSKKNLLSAQAQINIFKQAVNGLGISFATTVLPNLTSFVKGLDKMLIAINKLPTGQKKMVTMGVTAVAAIAPVSLAIGGLVKTFGALKAAMSFLGENKLFKNLGKFGKKELPETGSRLKSGSKRVPGSAILSGTSLPKRYRGQHRASTRLSRLKSGVKSLPGTLWSDAKTITKGGFNKGKSLLGKLPGVTRTGKIAAGGFKLAGKVASKIPILDVAMAGTNLIGMNQKNAGKKVGATAGMLGGGAIGSLLGPVGGVAGAAIGQTLGSKLGSTIQKTIPKKMQRAIGSSLKGIGKIFNNLLKPFKGTIRSVVEAWQSATKGISKNWNKYVVKPLSGKGGGLAIKSFLNGLKTTMIVVMKVGGQAFKILGGIVSTVFHVAGRVVSGFIKTISGLVSFVSDIFHGRWKNALKDAVQIFDGTFGTIAGIANDILKAVMNTVMDFVNNMGQLLAHPIKTIKSWFSGGSPSSGGDGITKHVKQVNDLGAGKKPGKQKKPKLSVNTGIHHAAGTARLPSLGPGVRQDEHAIVNDGGGSELVIFPNGKAILPRGVNTHMFLPKGSNVLNAGDTKSLLGPVHHASGTIKLKKAKNRAIALDFDAYGESAKKSLKSLKSLQTGSKKQWNSITKDTNKNTNSLYKNTVKDFDTMQKNALVQLLQMKKASHVQMNQMHKGMNAVTQDMVTDFYKIFGKLDNYTRKAMAAAIKQLNGGISGINTVLNKFGGGGSVLPLIHYAQGSKGPINKHTLAVVNDAKTGPRQEAIIDRDGSAYLPQGDNVVVPLKPGMEVLNGTETAQAQAVGALPHYAKGTGGLRRLIERSNKDSKKAWKRDFTQRANGKTGTFLAGALAKTTRGATNKVGLPWNNEVWSQLSDAMSGGSATGGAWSHSPGPGWSHTDHFGSPRSGGVHDGNDYSAGQGAVIHAVHGGKVVRAAMPPAGWGAVGYSIITKGNDNQYVMYQEFGNARNAKVSVGDVVRTGQPIATLGHSGLGTGPHVHIGVSKNYPFSNNGMSTSGWEDLMTMHGRSSGVKDAGRKTKNSALTRLVKNELKSKLSWVEKNLADNDVGGSSITSNMISKAMDMMKIPESIRSRLTKAILMTANSESGNRNIMQQIHDMNSGGNEARGPLQFTPGTFRAFAVKGHTNVMSPYAQVLAFLNNSDYKNATGWTSILGTRKYDWLHSGPQGHRRFANGGWAQNGAVNVFGEARGENEVAINTSRPSADPLLMEAISDRGKKSRSGVFAQFTDFLKMRKQAAEIKQSQVKFNEMRQSVTQPKAKTTIRPIIKFEPKIVVQNPANVDEAKQGAQAGVTASYADFKAMFDSYVEASMTN